MTETKETLAEMIAAVAPRRFQEGDLTVPIVRDQYKITDKRARGMLEGLVEKGEAEKFWGIGPNNRACNIYRKV